MPNTYTDTEKQLIVNDITDVDISTVTFNADELYLAPDNAVYSVNNATPVNGNVTITIPAKLSDLTDDTATYPIDKADYATSAGSATSATSATTASKLGSSDVGSATQPIYLDDGAATACTYSLAKSVPSDAVFTDTTYTFSTGLTESSGTVVVTDYNSLLKNTATGTNAVSIGTNSNGYGNYSTAIGTEAVAASNYTTTLGYGAVASAQSAGAIQIGYGTNSTANTLSVGFYYSPGTHYNYQLLDGTTGYIPSDRVNAVKEQRASGGLKFWTGTKAQYDAITTKDSNTLYNITDDTTPVVNKWTYSYIQLAKDISWTPNLPDTSYSLANYLPNDGYDYEVLVNASITTGTTSGNNVTLYFVSPAWGTIRVCSAVTRTSAGVFNSGTALVPVLANDRNITVKGNTSSSASGTYNIYLNGYRRA